MDPILNAVADAIAVLANTTLDVTLRKATADAYDGLKSLLKRKFGDKNIAVTLIDEIEVQHGSKAIIAEKGPMIDTLKLGSDPDILEAVRCLETAISKSLTQARVTNYYGSVYGPTGDHSKATYKFDMTPDTKMK